MQTFDWQRWPKLGSHYEPAVFTGVDRLADQMNFDCLSRLVSDLEFYRHSRFEFADLVALQCIAVSREIR